MKEQEIEKVGTAPEVTVTTCPWKASDDEH